MITIDGSSGEGGGQIVRSSLALSLATGEPVRIVNVRAGRKKPGLLRQHLTSLAAAVEIGGGSASGAELGSREITFSPGSVRAGDYSFAVGTAGSASLVVQTVLPALLGADGPSTLTVEGGTHNPFAPPFEFLEKTFLPLLARAGADVEATLNRHGFYPAGGGSMTLAIRPGRGLAPFELLDRGHIRRRFAQAIVAHLPQHIADRELKVVAKKLGFGPREMRVVPVRDSAGPGNVLLIELESESVTEVVAGFGEPRITAEAVADRAVKEARRYIAGKAPVGSHLADQLLLPLALAGGGAFRTLPLTRHARTNAEVIAEFLPVEVRTTGESDGTTVVEIARR